MLPNVMLWKTKKNKWSEIIRLENGLANGDATIWSNLKIIIWHHQYKSKMYWLKNQWTVFKKDNSKLLEVFLLRQCTNIENLFLNLLMLHFHLPNNQQSQQNMLNIQSLKKMNQKKSLYLNHIQFQKEKKISHLQKRMEKKQKALNSLQSNLLKMNLWNLISNLLNRVILHYQKLHHKYFLIWYLLKVVEMVVKQNQQLAHIIFNKKLHNWVKE